MNNPPRRPSGSSNSGTFLALFALLVVAAGLLALTAMVTPAVFGFLIVVFGFVFYGALHYVLWGWWVGRSSDRDDEEPSPLE